MNPREKSPIPGPATTPGQPQPTTKPEIKAPTADAADTHRRRRDEVQPLQNTVRTLEPKKREQADSD
jgi:hypothetical protein